MRRNINKQELNKIIKRLFIFFVPVLCLVVFYYLDSRRVLVISRGLDMGQQINRSFTNVISKKRSILFLGNSRIYRGVNPDLVCDNSYDFAFDNDTYFECWYKLDYLSRNNLLPDVLVMGVDYFEFSFISAGAKQYYSRYFAPEYAKIISEQKNIQFSEPNTVNGAVNQWLDGRFSKIGSIYFSYYWWRLTKGPYTPSYLRKNGQYIISPQPKASLADYLTRSSEVLPIQLDSYNRIISWCIEKKIPVVLVMPPLRTVEYDCYLPSDLKRVDSIFSGSADNGKNVYYLNYVREPFSLDEFMDDTHLNMKGADRFSAILKRDIGRILTIGKGEKALN